ncbi:hypothetical protein FRC09_015949 [Ceratobasidium sp. 395]|nr:hypothetical protein FRC09_015949 [Ceratobasidium sp. 395]
MFSVASSSRALQRNVTPIVFPSDWDRLEGPTFDWYRGLSCRHIHRLQIRKDSSGAVPHRFIVTHLTNGSIQRFDRRPKSKNSGEILAAGIFNASTIDAVDEIEAVELSAWSSLEKETKCEVDLDLEGSVDILTVLSACYGISRDESAHKYALLQFNCYFFSWTILAIVARHKIPSSIPTANQIYDRLQPRFASLTITLAGELSKVVMKAALDTITAFGHEVPYLTTWKGSNWTDRAIWAMPMTVMRFFLRHIMAMRIHPNLKPHIQKQLFSELGPKLRLMLESRLHAHLNPANVHDFLWFSEVQNVVEGAIRDEISNTIWDVVFDTVGGASSGIDVFQIAREVSQDRLREGHGGNEAQFSALWSAALYACLRAIRESAHGKVPDGIMTRESIFDEAWHAARDSALLAAQAAVRDTGPQLNNRGRDAMWEKIWEVWDPVWEAAQASARGAVLASVNNMANALVGSVVEAIILEIGGPQLRLAPVRLQLESEGGSVKSTVVEMTHAELQDFLQKLIRDSSREKDSLSIALAMRRVWKTSRKALSN